MTMNFAQPLWIFIGLGLCVGLELVFRLMQKKRQLLLEKFAAHQLITKLTGNVSIRKRRYKNILVLLAVFMCFVALARPQYGYKWVDVKRKGIDILFALDTSKSMLTEDIKPNRLKRARLAILDFVNQLEGDRVGLLPFAGSAYLMCPLTLDYDAFNQSLAAISTDIIPRGGTNIGAVIDKAVETLNNAANHKILVILTDGENLQGDTLQAATAATKQGLTIYTVGVGTNAGELIPLPGNGKGFIKDKNGNFVTSKLDEETLTKVAIESGGLYVPLGPSGEGLETIYQKKLALIPKTELAERKRKVPLERFEWALALALVFFCLELLTGERKTGKTEPLMSIIKSKIRRKNGLATLTLLLTCMAAAKSYASPGEDAYHRGDYLQASEYYSQKLETKPDDPVLNYNFGTSAYKNNMFDDASEAFSKALKSDDVALQEKAYYNKGNSLFSKGLESRQSTPQQTIEKWTQALQAMDSALALNTKNKDAEYNRDLIHKELEKLKKQQKQQQKNEKENKDKNPKNKDKQDKKDQSQNNTPSDKKDDQQKSKPQPGKSDKQDNPAKKNAAGDKDKPLSAANQDQEKKINDTQKEAARDAQRQQLGKMTREEAKRMLDALKNEEGKLNFVPSGAAGNEENVERDW